jgi:iron complex outermembrane receptor protein
LFTFATLLHKLNSVKYILAVLCIVWLSALQAQTCNLRLQGLVTDSDDGSKLEFATISIMQNQKQVFTKSDGTFEFNNLCPGTYTIVCSHIGCKDTTISLNLVGNIELNIVMPHKLNQLRELNVEGDKTNHSDAAGLSVVSVTSQQLQPLLGGTLGDILKVAPGVTTLQTGATIAKPMVNGFTGNRIVIMNNGVRLEGQQWGGEHAPEIDPYIANSVTVWYGAKAVRYGPDAIGGVITIDPATLPYNGKFSGIANLAAFSNNRMGAASLQIQNSFGKGRWAYRLQGSYRKGANVFTPGYGLDNTALREGNFSAALGYKNNRWKIEAYASRFDTKIGLFKGAHIGNLTDLLQAINSTTPFYTTNRHSYAIGRPYQQAVHYTGKLKAVYDVTEHSRLLLQYAIQNNRRQEYDRDLPLNDSLAALNRPEFLFDLTTQTLDAVYEFNRNGLALSGGLSAMYQSNYWQGRYFIPNFNAQNIGAFAIAEYTYRSFKFEAGLRYDIRFLEISRLIKGNVISPSYRYQNPSANVGVTYNDVLPGLNLGLNAGIAWRPPTVSELYSNGLHHGAAAFEIGDTAFSAEKAYTGSAVVYYQGNGIQFRVLGNYTYFDSYINLEPVLPPTLTIAGAFPTFKYRQGAASFTSVNISLAVDATKQLSLFTRNALIWAYNHSTRQYLIGAPAHRFQLGARYSFGDKNWFEKPYIELVAEHTMRQYLVDENADYAKPPAGYTLLNLEFGFTAHIRNSHIGITLVASNLLNTKFRDYLDRFRYYTDAMGRNVSLKLNIPFGAIKQ